MEKTNQPLYQQLMEDVRSQIENSLLLPGDKLPTEREFMQKYNVSRITVSKALNELKAEGLITRFPNKGSFVARSASPLAAAAQVPLEAPSVLLPASASAQLPAVPEGSTSDTAFTEIACILPSISDQFSLSMVNGILSAFPMDSYICHLFQSFNPSLENRLLQKCIDTGISGIVLFPQDQPFFSEQLLYLCCRNIPWSSSTEIFRVWIPAMSLGTIKPAVHSVCVISTPSDISASASSLLPGGIPSRFAPVSTAFCRKRRHAIFRNPPLRSGISSTSISPTFTIRSK